MSLTSTLLPEISTLSVNITSNFTDGLNSTVPSDAFVNIQNTDSLTHKTILWMERYIATSMLFVGVIGNALTFAVFSMKGYRGSLTSMLYRALAVADGIVVVLYDGLHSLPVQIVEKSVFTRNTVSCKMITSLYFWFRAFSGWVLVLIALERVIGVLFPHRAKVLCRKRPFGWMILGTSIVLLAFYAPLVFSIEHVAIYIDDVYYGGGCSTAPPGSPLEWYGVVFFNWMNLMAASILPFFFIITFNILIIYGILKARLVVKQASSYQSGSQKNNTVAILMSISVTFIILTLPYPVYFVLENIYRKQDSGSENYNKIMLLGAFAPICDSVNHSINIVLYCLCGNKFRTQLKALLCYYCDKARRAPPSSTGVAVTTSTAISDKEAATADISKN